MLAHPRYEVSRLIGALCVVLSSSFVFTACSASTSSQAESSADASSGGHAGAAGSGGFAGVDASAGADSSLAGAAGNVDDAGPDTSQDSSDASQDTSFADTSVDASNDTSASCSSNADCAGDPSGPYCDTSTGGCVECLPGDTSTCPKGSYCDSSTDTCNVGCDDDGDCQGASDTTTCDQTSHHCVGCVQDDDCAAGTVCQSNKCVAGCTPQHACPSPDSCCSGSCVDLENDLNNCGACGHVCQAGHAKMTCSSAKCSLTGCDNGYEDCDQNASNGCEVDTSSGSGCACVPSSMRPCYTGPAGTKGVGVCKGGSQVCDASGTKWGPCQGEVTPGVESCYTPADEDCDGQSNEGGIGCVCPPRRQGILLHRARLDQRRRRMQRRNPHVQRGRHRVGPLCG